MSKKILHNLFGYAAYKGIKKITIESQGKHLFFNCHSPHEKEENFTLPKKLEYDLADNLKEMLSIAPGDLANKKYCKISHKNYQLSFLASILPDKNGEKIIIDIIHQKNQLWRLSQLGLQNKSLKTIKEIINKRSGLIVISSPHTEGRSATFYALLQELNKDDLNIYLLEKDVTYNLPGINILDPTISNFNRVLRHDSNVIAFEATAEKENLKEALMAANSGRLVIMTIKAKNVWEILLKILNLDLPLKLKLDNLQLIINQRMAELKRPKKLS